MRRFATARFLRACLALALMLAGMLAAHVHAEDSDHMADSFTLANGLQVVVVPNHKVPAVTHMVVYKVGSIDEPLGKSGLAHFMEHLMFKATKHMQSGEFSRILAYNGGNENAFTSDDFTAYFQNIAKEKLPLVMELEAERMANLVLDDAGVEKERAIVLEERSSRIENQPRALLAEQMKAALYRNHRYGTPTIGWRHEIGTLTRTDAENFYQRYYIPNNALVVITGDVTTPEIKELAEKYYGTLAARPLEKRLALQEPPATTPITVRMSEANVRENEWLRYYLAPSAVYGNTKHAVPLSILSQILGGGETSRLYNALVVQQGLAVDASAYYDEVAYGPTNFAIFVRPKQNISLTSIQNAVGREIARIRQEGITQDELDRAKRVLRAKAIYALDGLKELAFVYGGAMAIGLDADYVEKWPRLVASTRVEDVNAALREVLVDDASVTGVLMRPAPKQTAPEQN